MAPIKVAIHGVLGKMGQVVLGGLIADSELEVVGGVDVQACQDTLPLPQGSRAIPLSQDMASLLQRCSPEVLVDFSRAEATLPAARVALRRGVSMVIGTTGLSEGDLQELDRLGREQGVGVVVASNFSLGAVMLIHLASRAAPYFDWVEILEMHGEQKADAPSGTALATAQALVKARGRPFSYAPSQKEVVPGPRGAQVQGVALHSLRMPGLLAHQEVIFGALGQTLHLRHDTISRESFLPGIMLAIKKVRSLKGLVLGLEKLMGLEEKP